MDDVTADGDLGNYADWVDEARLTVGVGTAVDELTIAEIRAALGSALAFGDPGRVPEPPQTHRTWRVPGLHGDRLRGEELSWDVGYGPRTRAVVIRPDTDEVLPGVVALHCHGHHKFHGAAKLVDGPDGPATGVQAVRDEFYGGQAMAQELARQGFVVMVHDVFLWGSRRFDAAAMARSLGRPDPVGRAGDAPGLPATAEEIAQYNSLAIPHEHLVAKYCSVLGTHLAAVISHEDRVAVAHLAGRSDVRPGGVGAIGLSGGGARTAYLLATSPAIGAAVIVGMMSSHRHLLERHVAPHTWMFFPPQLARLGDWPDVAASGAPTPLLVQYGKTDPLFTPEGMRSAHDQLERRYAAADAPLAYTGQWYDEGHQFSATMQDRAFGWLGERLS